MKKNQIIFDSQCDFCNNTVKVIAKQDLNNRFVFIASASDLGNDLLNKYGLKTVAQQSIILIQNNQFYSKSVALQKIILQLPRWKTVGYLLYIVPKFVADWVYSLISKNRKLLCLNNECKNIR